jgi:ankyrin repeat protein
MKRILMGLALAVMTTAVAGAQSANLDKILKMVEKCQIPQLQPVLSVTTGTELSAKDSQGVPFMVKAAETSCDEGIEMMIKSGAEVNSADSTGRTVLHAAVEKSNEKVVKILLTHGAKIDAVTKSGETVLQAAAKNMFKGKTEQRDKILKLLKDKGAK